ncbi:DUF6998 domain-containing protein [Rhodospirillaceae bacterium SYSU D60014]|uniref:DUF6998 domain-containing protein n=1 Tax=Virgifigura deserti TaxID=2268457 RepID=UPI000E667653
MTEAFVRELPDLLNRLFEIVDCLERFVPQRKFTPDGHLVGSIGDAVAAYAYGLALLSQSGAIHDASAASGQLVQVKLTGRDRNVQLTHPYEHLIVLRLTGRREFREVYNGPGAPPWALVADQKPLGAQRPISLTVLQRLQNSTPADLRIPQIRSFPVWKCSEPAGSETL